MWRNGGVAWRSLRATQASACGWRWRSCSSLAANLDPFSAAYRAALASGQLEEDEAQAAAARVLARVSGDVEAYLKPHTEPLPQGSWFSRIFGGRPRVDAPRGAYIWSNKPGGGKTMLVDMMYDSTGSLDLKRRDHFHSFALEVHARLHERRFTSVAPRDKLGSVARELASEFKLLVVDEFQVTDISDAVIMHQLFKNMFAYGIVVVATSNRAPDELYANGIQRELFVPLIPMLYEHMEVHEIGSTLDYRLRHSGAKSSTYFVDADGGAGPAEEKFRELAAGFPVSQARLPVVGRTLVLPTAVPDKRIALFKFDELCERPLSAADYRAIVSHYHTVFLTDIPVLDVIMDRNAVRRLTTFVDFAYEARVKLVLHAEALPSELIRGASRQTKAETEEGFAVGRLISRLIEMQTSDQYLSAPWNPPMPQELKMA